MQSIELEPDYMFCPDSTQTKMEIIDSLAYSLRDLSQNYRWIVGLDE